MRQFCQTALLSALLVALTTGGLFAQATLTAVRIPNAIADAGGTGTVGYPYAVFVQIQNWTAGASSQAYLKIYNGTTNEYMWSATGAWSNTTTYANTNQPVVNIDAGGNWSGWIYAKHNTSLGVAGAVRAAKVGATTTNLTGASKTFTILTMTTAGNGGWILRQISPAVNKGIVAYSGGLVVGTYRTEDNNIVEGYPYSAGGFKMAVPAGFVDSLVTFNDDGTRDQAFVGPWVISAGQETDATSGGGQIGRGSSSITPSTLSGGVSHSLMVKLRGESPYIVRTARIAVPSSWTWDHTTGSITLVGGGSPTARIAGDTIVITNMTLSGPDSLQVQMNNFTPFDTTANFAFQVRTGTHPDSVFAIGTQPTIFIYSTPFSIGTVKENDTTGVPLLNNRLVTVRGIVTVANEFGGPSYIQDNSGGLAIFGSAFSRSLGARDEVIVSGLVQPFRGLTEIVSPILHSIVSRGNSVTPVSATALQIANDGRRGVEQFECLLVRLNAVTVTGSGSWLANNYPLTDATGTSEVRIDDSTNIVGTPIPAGAFDLIGVVGQFIQTPPYIGGYQIMPRSTADIISTGPIIATVPVESNILPNSLTISWQTLGNGSSKVRYGRTPAFELGVTGNDTPRTNHVVVLSSLDPATPYYIKAFSVAPPETSSANTLIASTRSPVQATGQMNVYFNKSVNTRYAWYQQAQGGQNLPAKLIQRINGARRSIDVAIYSMSGQPGNDIAAALVNAKLRGVKVRVICETDNRNTPAFDFLATNGVPLIDDRFDPVNNGAGLMHNKFLAFDGRGGAPESVWVWTGSWNLTDQGSNSDFQNSIEIQDPALAGAYLLEFNEMWGSDTDVPNATNSRFGARKTDNTPHRFVIGGKNVESYFSPTDGVTSRIVSTINSAQHSIGFQLLTLTRAEIGGALVAKKQGGLKVRGNLDNSSDQGTQYPYLIANGVDVRLKTGVSGLLHHKYGIFDAEDPHWNAVTITGSHNWTGAAENSNNENTLIVRDGNITNQYLQEFAARYYQFGGSDSILVGVDQTSSSLPAVFSLAQNYPNPFNPTTTIRFQLPATVQVSLKVFNILGQEVATLVNGQMTGGAYSVEMNSSRLASGVYFYKLDAGSYSNTKRLVVLK